MGAAFEFDGRIDFRPEAAGDLLRLVPALPGIFALRGERTPEGRESEPYLTRTADLRRRLRRLLAPPEELDEHGRPILSRRLNLRERVRSIEWTVTGSEFESSLLLYRATLADFGDESARRRLRLYPPYFLRLTTAHRHPRVYVTNRLSVRSLPESFGPFPSRAAAERYCDAVLDLFKLRRCHEDLQPFPDHPGCAYGEMKRCLAPCKEHCTADDYKAEAERVRTFFATGGESLLSDLARQREAASEAMDFEGAAALHKQWEKARAAAQLADDLVRAGGGARALIVQPAATRNKDSARDEAAVFLLENGRILGPERLSTLGVRAVREQTAVGSSLFAQPLMLSAVPLAPGPEEATSAAPATEDTPCAAPQGAPAAPPVSAAADSALLTPEGRAHALLQRLEARAAGPDDPSIAERCDILSLFRRWYYRPEKQRVGDVLLPNADGAWPVRRLLNGAARVALGPPAAADPVDREAAKAVRTRMLHAGRADVERAVAVLPKRKRAQRSAEASSFTEKAAESPRLE